MKHGTSYTYRVYRCRCELCRSAHAAAQRKYRERRSMRRQIDAGQRAKMARLLDSYPVACSRVIIGHGTTPMDFSMKGRTKHLCR